MVETDQGRLNNIKRLLYGDALPPLDYVDWLIDLAQEALDRREADREWAELLAQAGQVFEANGARWMIVWSVMDER